MSSVEIDVPLLLGLACVATATDRAGHDVVDYNDGGLQVYSSLL